MQDLGRANRVAVLAVDDTPANLLALQAVLAPVDAEVVTASSGAEALELAATRDFAVMLLDVMMPGIDGLETLRQLRARPSGRHLPVILVTAHEMDRLTTRRAYALGAVDYLIKPLEPEILLSKVTTFVVLKVRELQINTQAEALKAKDRHIAVLAHDLRNPLQVIETAALRLSEHEDESIRITGARISRAAARMSKLAQDVLEFARAASKKLRLERSKIDLAELCRELVEDVRTAHPGVRFACHGEGKVMGSWDRSRLSQALTNLLANAAKYGDGNVSVRCELIGSAALVRVDNGGPGIAPEQLARVFEPFERGADTKGRGGVGLGLSIVREIARAHAGDVEASCEGGITSFRLALPCDALEPGAVADNATRALPNHPS